MEENGVRINKFLSEAGVCSRREADRQIEADASPSWRAPTPPVR